MTKSEEAVFSCPNGSLQEGRTLRQWYAGQALIAMSGRIDRNGTQINQIKDVVQDAFIFADEMLKIGSEGE